MSLYSFIFYFFEAAAALAALSLVFSKNVFYGALLLIVCLLSVAGLYVLAFAEFVAVTQIMVYAGGVLVLIIFGIMLTAKLGKKALEVKHVNLYAGSILCLVLFILLSYYLQFLPSEVKAFDRQNIIEEIGINFLTSHIVPFELAGILLLVALIGSAVIASHKSRETEE